MSLLKHLMLIVMFEYNGPKILPTVYKQDHRAARCFYAIYITHTAMRAAVFIRKLSQNACWKKHSDSDQKMHALQTMDQSVRRPLSM